MKVEDRKNTALTDCDFPATRLLEEPGAHAVLVGETLTMFVLET